MVLPSLATPVASDGGKMDGRERTRPLRNRFEWVSSSPTPATVSALVRQFPEVVQAPLPALEAETVDWGSKAVIARSLSRWVPPEAIVRELRRVGAAGSIEPLCLAHRHYLIRFSDPVAKQMMLGNPWAVNGQVIAVENWRPEFVPTEVSLSSALLWIRLPSLPLEFWNEDILSPILAAAGRFLFLDAATKERKRGGYARACVQVDLGKPLRPGVRVRGTGVPFWQSFVYEHLDGFCPLCGAIHSSEGCPSPPVAPSDSPSPLFGPWMSAVRRRSSPQAVVSDSALKTQKASASSSPGASDGWHTPKKTSRRHSLKMADAMGPVFCPTAVAVGSGVSGGGSPHGSSSGGSGNDPVVGGLKPVMTESQSLFTVPVLAENNTMSETLMNGNQSIMSSNPFAMLGSDKWAGRPKSQKEANPGPLKRARPVEPSAPRVGPKSSKGKGKIHAASKHDMEPSFTFSASVSMPEVFGAQAGQGTPVIKASEAQPFGECAEAPPEHRSHDSVVCLLKKAIQGEVEGAGMGNQVHGTLADDPNDSGPPDTEMTGDRVDPPQPK